MLENQNLEDFNDRRLKDRRLDECKGCHPSRPRLNNEFDKLLLEASPLGCLRPNCPSPAEKEVREGALRSLIPDDLLRRVPLASHFSVLAFWQVNIALNWVQV